MYNNQQRSNCVYQNQKSNYAMQRSMQRCDVCEQCERNNDSCDDERSDFRKILNSGIFPLAMGYVPWQTCMDDMENETYNLEKGLRVGTIFPCLDKPFLGRGIC